MRNAMLKVKAGWVGKTREELLARPDTNFPDDFWTLPRAYLHPPSADYQTSRQKKRDVWQAGKREREEANASSSTSSTASVTSGGVLSVPAVGRIVMPADHGIFGKYTGLEYTRQGWTVSAFWVFKNGARMPAEMRAPAPAQSAYDQVSDEEVVTAGDARSEKRRKRE